jgi:uncharacterized NAD(P)/FAD-binding protein YdhS
MSWPIEIGIVGGGASAVCLLDALARAPGAPGGGITVFEPSPHLWRGRSFQPDTRMVRVNIPPEGMSVRFGDYLEQSAHAALTRFRQHGWRINLIRQRVDSATPDGNRVTLQTEHGQRVTVHYTVLCVGAGRPTDTYALAGAPGFVCDPYPLSGSLVGIDAAQEVGVIGSGLTAVDVVLALAARGHQGRIRLLSRSGLLPMVRQHAVSATGPDVWPLLPEQDKAHLLRSHYRTVLSLCCPMPPTRAAALLELVDSGQLEIITGIRHIKASTGGGFTIIADDREHTADVMINAVNAATRKIPPMAEPLITSLVAAGLADRHPHGGLHVDRATSRLITGSVADQRLYALGDLASGSMFCTFGLPSLVDRAYDIVAGILDDLGGATSSWLDHVLQIA